MTGIIFEEFDRLTNAALWDCYGSLSEKNQARVVNGLESLQKATGGRGLWVCSVLSAFGALAVVFSGKARPWSTPVSFVGAGLAVGGFAGAVTVRSFGSQGLVKWFSDKGYRSIGLSFSRLVSYAEGEVSLGTIIDGYVWGLYDRSSGANRAKMVSLRESIKEWTWGHGLAVSSGLLVAGVVGFFSANWEAKRGKFLTVTSFVVAVLGTLGVVVSRELTVTERTKRVAKGFWNTISSSVFSSPPKRPVKKVAGWSEAYQAIHDSKEGAVFGKYLEGESAYDTASLRIESENYKGDVLLRRDREGNVEIYAEEEIAIAYDGANGVLKPQGSNKWTERLVTTVTRSYGESLQKLWADLIAARGDGA